MRAVVWHFSAIANIKIEFQGGEPLLNFRLIQKIVVGRASQAYCGRKTSRS